MLDSAIKDQLKGLFAQLEAHYTFDIFVHPQHESRAELVDLLEEVASCSDKLSCRLQAGRRGRVEAGQAGVDRRPAVNGRLGVDFGAQRRVGLRQFGQALQQGAEIEDGSPDQQRHFAGRSDLGHRRQRVGAEAGSRVALLGGDQVDQPVRVTGQGCRVGLGGPQVHVHENLGRIDADQFDRKAVGQGHGDGGLARGGRAHEQDGRRQVRGFHGGEC